MHDEDIVCEDARQLNRVAMQYGVAVIRISFEHLSLRITPSDDLPMDGLTGEQAGEDRELNDRFHIGSHYSIGIRMNSSRL